MTETTGQMFRRLRNEILQNAKKQNIPSKAVLRTKWNDLKINPDEIVKVVFEDLVDKIPDSEFPYKIPDDCNECFQEIQALEEKIRILEIELKTEREAKEKQKAQEYEDFFANQPLNTEGCNVINTVGEEQNIAFEYEIA